MDSEKKKPAKKTYESPKLVVYGDIGTITRASAPVGMGDGGMAGAVKS